MTDINDKLQRGLKILFNKNVGDEMESIDERTTMDEERRQILEFEE